MNLTVKILEGPVEVIPEGVDVVIYPQEMGGVIVQWGPHLDLFRNITSSLVEAGINWGARRTLRNAIIVTSDTLTCQEVLRTLFGTG